MHTMNANYTGTDSKVISQSETKLIAERLNENILLHQTDAISVQALNNGFEFKGKNGIPAAYVFNYLNGWFHEGSWNSPTVGNYQYNRRYYKNIHN